MFRADTTSTTSVLIATCAERPHRIMSGVMIARESHTYSNNRKPKKKCGYSKKVVFRVAPRKPSETTVTSMIGRRNQFMIGMKPIKSME